MEITVPQKLKDAVAQGVITVDYHLTVDGIDSWVRFVQPHPRLGITTSTSFRPEDVDDYLDKINGHSQSPSGALRRISDSLRGSPKVLPTAYKVPDEQEARRLVVKHMLNMYESHGIAQTKPSDSIHLLDLSLPIEHLGARMRITLPSEESAVRRIATDSRLHVESVANLNDWWLKSTPVQKWILLTKRKRSGETQTLTFKGEHHVSRLNLFRCPFQNSDLQEGQSEESDSSTGSKWDGGLLLGRALRFK